MQRWSRIANISWIIIGGIPMGWTYAYKPSDVSIKEFFTVRIRNWQDFEFDIMPGEKSNATV